MADRISPLILVGLGAAALIFRGKGTSAKRIPTKKDEPITDTARQANTIAEEAERIGQLPAVQPTEQITIRLDQLRTDINNSARELDNLSSDIRNIDIEINDIEFNLSVLNPEGAGFQLMLNKLSAANSLREDILSRRDILVIEHNRLVLEFNRIRAGV